MSNQRFWTWRDDLQVSEEEKELRTPAIDDLVARWNVMHNDAEQRGFRRQAAMESGEYDEPDFETEEEMKSFQLRQQVSRKLEAAQMNAIESALHELGARMMRPYEHWNEDEQLMSYLERDY